MPTTIRLTMTFPTDNPKEAYENLKGIMSPIVGIVGNRLVIDWQSEEFSVWTDPDSDIEKWHDTAEIMYGGS